MQSEQDIRKQYFGGGGYLYGHPLFVNEEYIVYFYWMTNDVNDEWRIGKIDYIANMPYNYVVRVLGQITGYIQVILNCQTSDRYKL